MPMSDGRCPWIWLTPTSNCSNEEILKIEAGIVPEKLFELTPKNEKVSSIGQKNQE